MHTHPYEQKQPADLPGEAWKDIPEFEGSYQASSFGRVRSIDRYILHSRIGLQFVKGRILSQSVARNKNIQTGEPMIDLRVTLALGNKLHYFNVRRLVYACFVAKINYEEDGLYVINKDSDGYNNRVSNLALVTKSIKQQRIFKRERQISTWKTADRSAWGKNYGGVNRRKAVEQYNPDGLLVGKYVSISEASRITGCGEKEIRLAAKGAHKQAGGFVWKFVVQGRDL